MGIYDLSKSHLCLFNYEIFAGRNKISQGCQISFRVRRKSSEFIYAFLSFYQYSEMPQKIFTIKLLLISTLIKICINLHCLCTYALTGYCDMEVSVTWLLNLMASILPLFLLSIKKTRCFISFNKLISLNICNFKINVKLSILSTTLYKRTIIFIIIYLSLKTLRF